MFVNYENSRSRLVLQVTCIIRAYRETFGCEIIYCQLVAVALHLVTIVQACMHRRRLISSAYTNMQRMSHSTKKNLVCHVTDKHTLHV